MKIQAKHLSDDPAMRHLASLAVNRWASMCDIEKLYPDIPIKVIRAKMASLIRRGLVDGCCCGCRGDFHLTDNGRLAVERMIA